MKLYIHPVNPHYAPTHAEAFSEGWRFGIWEYPYPALEPAHYRLQSKHLRAAQVARKQAEGATQHLDDEPVHGSWLALPQGVEPHSEAAARGILQTAARGCQPVQWPWTKAAQK